MGAESVREGGSLSVCLSFCESHIASSVCCAFPPYYHLRGKGAMSCLVPSIYRSRAKKALSPWRHLSKMSTPLFSPLPTKHNMFIKNLLTGLCQIQVYSRLFSLLWPNTQPEATDGGRLYSGLQFKGIIPSWQGCCGSSCRRHRARASSWLVTWHSWWQGLKEAGHVASRGGK